MKKKNKYAVILGLFFITLLCSTEVIANQEVSFLSLKNKKVNLRQGPSFEYPIKLIYTKKYLPVIILNKSETWRQIKDIKNNTGWIHMSQLSKKKTAITKVNSSIMYKKYTIYSKPIAKLAQGRLVLIKKCRVKWCKVTSGEFKGWVLKKSLWGKIN